MPSFCMTRHHETCTPLLPMPPSRILFHPHTNFNPSSASQSPTIIPSPHQSSYHPHPTRLNPHTHPYTRTPTYIHTMPAPPSLSRLADLLKLRCSIYQQLYNPLNIRTGSKVLRQRLKGAAIASYYPRRMVSMKELQGLYPELET